MKQMLIKDQVQANGGLTYYGYCVKCGYTFSAISSQSLAAKGLAHFNANGGASGGHRWNRL